MSTQSGFAGYGMKNLVDKSLERLNVQNAQKIAIMEQMAITQAQQQAQQQALLATQEPQTTNPMLDPNGNFARYLAEKKLTMDDYLNMPTIARERELVQPYLEQRWVTDNLPAATSSGLRGQELAREKEAFMRDGRAMAMADFSDRQAEVGTLEKVGSLVNAGARGVVGLADSASGLIKTVAGDKNTASEYIDKGVDYAEASLKEMNNAEQEELVQYFQHLARNGKVAEMAKLAVDYPSLFADQMIEQVAPMGVFSKGISLAGKGAKALQGAKVAEEAGQIANVASKGKGLMKRVTGGNGTVMAYSGYQMGGGMAQELSDAGIDPSSEGGVKAVLYSGLGGATISRFAPATLEKTFMNNLLGKGVSEKTAKVIAQQELQKLTSGGLFKSPIRYASGLVKSGLKGGLGEGAEEGLQSGLEGYSRQMVTNDGKWRDLDASPWTEADKEAVSKRVATGVALGFGLGAGMKAGVNTMNRYGDSDKADLVNQNAQYWADAGRGVFSGPSTRAEGYDPATFDPNTLNKRERALYDFAEENRIKNEQKVAEDVANKQIDDDHIATFGEGNKDVARTDYDNVTRAQAVTTAIDETINDIVVANSGKVQGVPSDAKTARAELDQITDPVAKTAKLQEWAEMLASPELKAKAGEIAQKFVAGYDFAPDGTYSNVKQLNDAEIALTTAIVKATGKPVTDLDATVETLRQSNPEFGKYVDTYKEAIKRGYTNTAEQVVKDFESAIAKWQKKNPATETTGTVSDVVNRSRRANGRDVATIAEAIFGTRGWNSKNGRDAYNGDPITFIDGLTDHVATSGRKALSDEDAQTIISELEKLKQAWESDQDYKLKLPPDLISRLTTVK